MEGVRRDKDGSDDLLPVPLGEQRGVGSEGAPEGAGDGGDEGDYHDEDGAVYFDQGGGEARGVRVVPEYLCPVQKW